MSEVLEREIFETSRELEYFSEKELTAQIGYEPECWPVAILRELVDNALDAAESVGVLPKIKITTDNDCISVSDNGPGIPSRTIERSLDYLVRVSNKAHYISPTRGVMGNALKVIWTAPFVATGGGSVEVVAQGRRHRVEIALDRIAQRPEIKHTCEPAVVRNGTSVRISWSNSTRLLREPKCSFYNAVPTAAELIAEFAAFNPHATFTLDGQRFERTPTDWKKWSPNQPTSAHWYDEVTLRDLIAAYIARERDGGRERTVREFVSEFRGLSSTAKQKAVTGAWSGKRLHDFVRGGDVDDNFVAELLAEMQAASSPPAPKLLGLLGQVHLREWMTAQGVAESSIKYRHKAGIDGLPYVLEVSFGVNEDDNSTRRIITGLNWSPVIGDAPGATLRSAISESRLDPNDPVTLVVHIARPRFQFADRGKTRVSSLGDGIDTAITAAIKSVTKAWKKAKRSADRNDRVSQARIARLRYKPPKVTIREVAFEVMEDAYNKASSNGRYYANARQIMYAARPVILAECDADEFNSVYFTQTLLKDYLELHSPDWKVVWDARGNLVEPHTGHKVSLGGLAVKEYMDDWSHDTSCLMPEIESRIHTRGPNHRFANVLFVEKEGFAPILADAGIGERYDMAVMSTKGIPVDAACDLIQAMHSQDARIFVLHDFDLAGFKIARTLRVGTRLSEGTDVIDIGLRMEDIEGLPSEPVSYKQLEDPASYLLGECDAMEDEADFLVGAGSPGRWRGQRVEINAMTSEQLLTWLERKFEEHDVLKVVPDIETLRAAYKRAVFLQCMEARIAELQKEIRGEDVNIPNGISGEIEAMLKEEPNLSWDNAVWRLVDDYADGESNGNGDD